MKRAGSLNELAAGLSADGAPSATSAAHVEVEPRSSGGVLVLANVLPVSLTREGQGRWSAALDADTARAMWVGASVGERFPRVTYIGCPPCFVPPAEEEAVTRTLRPLGCVPVFLSRDVASKHYQGYVRGVLWPTFHSVVDVYNARSVAASRGTGTGTDTGSDAEDDGWARPRSWNPTCQELVWPAYCQANRAVASRVVEHYHPGDVVWVHGIELLLVPSYLVRRLRDANVGLFLHAPFPPSTVFLTLANREELLRSILNTNHVGMHTFEAARNLFTAASLMLGLGFAARPGGSLAIDYHGRDVVVSCMHKGVDVEAVRSSIADEPEDEDQEEEDPPEHLVASVDVIEGLSGLSLKLLAFDRFLATHASMRGRVRLHQLGLRPDSRPDDYAQTRADALALVAQVNAKWGAPGQPAVVFEEAELGEAALPRRMALWRRASVLLKTPVRAGFDAGPFEFVLAHEASTRRPGVVVLSEFASCSVVLARALRVNPWNVDQVVLALGQACGMGAEERRARHAADLARVLDSATPAWARRVLDDVADAFSHTGQSHQLMGFGLAYRFQLPTTARRLEADDVGAAYRRCHRRLLFLDVGGTLTDSRDELRPGAERLTLLRGLCADARNHVFAAARAPREELEAALGDVAGLGLVANGGYYVRWPGATSWTRLPGAAAVSSAWREAAMDIMQIYRERTNASTLTATDTSLTFDYAAADAEFGALQAAQLVSHLGELLDAYELDVQHADTRVEVNPKGANKGAAVRAVLDGLDQRGTVDFVLCVGDDHTDELAFEAVNEAATELGIEENAFTCTVGKKPTSAHSFVNDSADVVDALASLARRSMSGNRSLSVADLASMGRGSVGVPARSAASGGGAAADASAAASAASAEVRRQVAQVAKAPKAGWEWLLKRRYFALAVMVLWVAWRRGRSLGRR